jgi:hypothetical protein
MSKITAPAAITGATPALAILIDNLIKAEARWGAHNRKSEASRATKAAWAKVKEAERAIVRFRSKSFVDISAKFRMEAYLTYGNAGNSASMSRLYGSILKDIDRVGQKGGGDGALIQAEQDSLATWKRTDKPREANGDLNVKMTDRACDLDRFIGETRCYTLAGAAAKLRRLLDPEVGWQGGDAGYEFKSLRQILAMVERLAGGAA